MSRYTSAVFLTKEELAKLEIPLPFHLGAIAALEWTSRGLPFEIFKDLCLEAGLPAPEREAFDWYMARHSEKSKSTSSKRQ
mgnify:CR=1 FL=1